MLAGFFSILLEFPARQHTSQRNQRSEALYIFRNPCHDLICQSLILKTLVGIIKKTAPEQRMVEKRLTGASRHLQRILGDNNTRETKPVQPSTNVC